MTKALAWASLALGVIALALPPHGWWDLAIGAMICVNVGLVFAAYRA